MNTISKLATAFAFAALAACGGGSETNTTDANMTTDLNAGMTDMNADMNAGMTDMNATDMNMGGGADMNADANMMGGNMDASANTGGNVTTNGM
jgi:hypothetical protein